MLRPSAASLHGSSVGGAGQVRPRAYCIATGGCGSQCLGLADGFLPPHMRICRSWFPNFGLSGARTMQTAVEAVLLRVFVGADDRHGERALYETIVERAREMKLACSTLLPGPESYRQS